MARKATTYKDAFEIIIRQLDDEGLPGIPCYRCKVPFTVEDVRAKPTEPNAIQKEHLHPIAMDGPDTPENCRLSHNACHKIETNGNGATTAGSSKHQIAKTKRVEKARLEEEALTPSQKLMRKAESKAAHLAKPKQKWPKRKIQNRKDFK